MIQRIEKWNRLKRYHKKSQFSQQRHQTPLSLRLNISWTLIGNLFYGLCQWGILMLLAKLGSPEIVGIFSLGLAITTPIILFSELQLRAIISTDLKDDYLFSDYLGLRIVTNIIAMALIIAIAIFAGYSSMMALVICMVGLAKAFEATSDIFLGLFQKFERIDRLAFSLIIKGVLSLFAMGVGLYLSGSILWAVIALCLARIFVLFWYDIPNASLLLKNFMPQISNSSGENPVYANSLKPRFNLKTLKKITILALPLGFVTMLISLNGNIPRYFIEHYDGLRELGIFSAMAYIVIIGGRVIVATGHAIYPRLARYYIDGRQKALMIFMFKLLFVAALLGIVGILTAKFAGRKILTILYTAEYADYQDVFVWLMVSAGFRYMTGFLNYVLTASRFLKIQVPLNSISVVILLAACFILIPKYDLIGAAYAVTLSSAVLFITHLTAVTYILNRMKHKKIRKIASITI